MGSRSWEGYRLGVAAGTAWQELFRHRIFGKQRGLKPYSTYVSAFVLYRSFLDSKILASGISEFTCHRLRHILD